jgi:hypothetical protein
MHIPKLQAIAGVEVVSVANRSPASAQKVRKTSRWIRSWAN